MFAQIEQEILSFVDSTELIVNNRRKMIINNLAQGNTSKAIEVYFYLSELTADNNSAAFYYNEDMLIGLLIRNWYMVMELMEHYQKRLEKQVYSSSDALVSTLYRMMLNNIDSISGELKVSVFDPESKILSPCYH